MHTHECRFAFNVQCSDACFRSCNEITRFWRKLCKRSRFIQVICIEQHVWLGFEKKKKSLSKLCKLQLRVETFLFRWRIDSIMLWATLTVCISIWFLIFRNVYSIHLFMILIICACYWRCFDCFFLSFCLWFILWSWFMPVYINKLKICHSSQVEWHHTHTQTHRVNVSRKQVFSYLCAHFGYFYGRKMSATVNARWNQS